MSRNTTVMLAERTNSAKPIIGVLMAALIALFAAFLLAVPTPAHAKSYTCPQVDISAQAQTDGTLHVAEQRTFDFDGTFSAVWWYFWGLPWDAEVEIASMRMAQVNAQGEVVGEWTTLPEVAFQYGWREEGGPATAAWSFDEPQNTVYAFFNVTDERVVIELDYAIINGVSAYEDVAEIYWKYIPEGWSVDSENVTLNVALPVPSGVEVVPGENVRAWGHGPLDGQVSIGEDGVVDYTVSLVRAGQFAEARITFPRSWLTNLDPEIAQNRQGIHRLDTVLEEEAGYADSANTFRMISLISTLAVLGACILMLAIALFLSLRYGREYTPDFTGEYWRDVPEPGMQPALIGRLWRWNHESPNDLTATIMHLAHIGAIRIDRGSYVDAKGQQVEDYYLTRVEPKASQLTDPIELATMEFLFEKASGGRPSLWLGTIRAYGKNHPQEYVDAVETWQGILTAQTNKQDFIEARSKRLQGVVGTLAVLCIVAAIASVFLTSNFLYAIMLVPTGIALFVITNYMPRRTVYGNNIVARCKALRNWLRDFSSLDERPPTDVKVWGEFMVYAYLFGVAEQTMRELQNTVPEVLAADSAAQGVGASYVPWWVWYSAGTFHGANGAAVTMPSVGDMLNTSVNNTLATAQAVISTAHSGSGGFSSGGGFGGGFSGGGGGGFGGGGGAR